MNNTPETKSFYVTAFDVEEWAEKCIRLEKERDEAKDKYATEATEHMLAVNKICNERDEALSQIAQAEKRAERYCQERDEARNDIIGWENKWKFAVEMAARAELERDEALNKIKELNDILR